MVPPGHTLLPPSVMGRVDPLLNLVGIVILMAAVMLVIAKKSAGENFFENDHDGSIKIPGGREAGISARTGASTIFMLLRRILLLYLNNAIFYLVFLVITFN